MDKVSCFTPDTVNEIFRIMYMIKGSSAMLLLFHAVEGLFYFKGKKKLKT